MSLDVDRLIDLVTKEIMRRLSESGKDCVLVTDGCPQDVVSESYCAVGEDNPGECKYVLLTEAAYRALIGGAPAAECRREPEPCLFEDAVDLRGKRLLHERDLRDCNAHRGTVVRVSKKTIVTALANDYAKGLGAKIVREN